MKIQTYLIECEMKDTILYP